MQPQSNQRWALKLVQTIDTTTTTERKRQKFQPIPQQAGETLKVGGMMNGTYGYRKAVDGALMSNCSVVRTILRQND